MAPLPINFIQFQFGGMICLRLARAWGMKSLLRRRCYLSNRYILRLSSGQNALAPYLLLHSSLPEQGFWKRTLLDSMPRRSQDSAGCCKSEHFCSDYEELKPGQLNKIDNKIAKVYQSNIVYYIVSYYIYIYIKVDQTTTMDSLSEQQVHQHQHIHPRMNPQRRRQPLKLSCSCQSLYLRGRQPYSTEWSSSASAQTRYSQ